MAENSTLRRKFFIVFLWELFCYNEEHFLTVIWVGFSSLRFEEGGRGGGGW